MKSRYILLLGALGSGCMGLLDYAGKIDVENWTNLIPFGLSVIIAILVKGGFDFIGTVVEVILD